MPNRQFSVLSQARIRMGSERAGPSLLLPALVGGLFAGMIFCLLLMIYWTLADRRR